MKPGSVAPSRTIKPTNQCFDDALDYIEMRVAADRTLVDAERLFLLHGIATIPEGPRKGKPFAHAWVEEVEGDLVWQGGIVDGEHRFWSMPRADFYLKYKIQKSTRYSLPEADQENAKWGTYGPWIEEYLRLCLPKEQAAAPIQRSQGPVHVILRGAYARLDQAVNELLRVLPEKTTCTKGCAHCCHYVALLHPSEGYSIAVSLLTDRRPELPAVLRKLRANALEHCYVGIDEENYYAQRIPCPFLVDRSCSIYDVRPSSCRYHFALTPPEVCANDEPVTVVNLRKYRDHIAYVDRDIQEQGFGHGEAFIAPLPISVLWGLRIVLEERGQLETEIGRSVVHAARDIPSPLEWMGEFGENLRMRWE